MLRWGSASVPRPFIAVISFGVTAGIQGWGSLWKTMSQDLIPLKWQPLGQGLLRPINPPCCCLGQICQGGGCRQMHALSRTSFVWPSPLKIMGFLAATPPSLSLCHFWPGSPCFPSQPIPGDNTKWQRNQFPEVNKQAVCSQKQSRSRNRLAGRSRSF